MQWHDALECVRAECRLMSCVPARNVVKLAEAIIEGELTRLSSLVSVAIHAPSVLPGTGYQHLEDLFAESQRHVPEDGAHVRFLSELAKCLKAFVEEDAVAQLPLLHQVARRYPQRRSADDATQKSRISRRLNAQIHPRRVLLIQEEESHEKAGSPIQSTASVTLLSAMLSLGVGPGPENVLHCDATTTKDDVLRFLHSVLSCDPFFTGPMVFNPRWSVSVCRWIVLLLMFGKYCSTELIPCMQLQAGVVNLVEGQTWKFAWCSR